MNEFHRLVRVNHKFEDTRSKSLNIRQRHPENQPRRGRGIFSHPSSNADHNVVCSIILSYLFVFKRYRLKGFQIYSNEQ